ncbi:MAG: hypothetical protein II811_00840, partial [Spirochaetaceae bacterium]|nr:hypothetical protein [Spirochaetaceae bacterium]
TVASCYANGWKFSALLITWRGETSTDWATESNWDLGIVPGSTNLEDAKVIIPDSLSNYPLTSSAYTVGSITVGTEDATAHNATLTLGANITATDTITNYSTLKLSTFDITASEIKNYGTLNLAGSQTITGTKTNGANSSVEYFGSPLSSLPWGASYVNLSFVTGAAGSITDALSVSGATTIANGSTNTLSLTSNANAFSGGVVLNGAGTISLNANSTISLKKASGTTKIACNSLALYNSATTDSALEAAYITIGTSTTLTAGGAISTTNTLTNNGTLALGTNALSFGSYTGTSDKITATAGGSITQSGSTASAISSLSLTPSGTAVFTLNGGSGLTLTAATYNATPLKTTGTVNTAVTTGTDKIGALTVSSGTTTLGGNTAITSVSIASGATLSAGSTATDAYTLTISGNWTNSNTSGGFAANNSTVQFTGINVAISGSQTFYKAIFSGVNEVSGNNTITNAIFTGNTTLSGNNTITTFTAETGGIALTVNGPQTISGKLTLSGAENNLLSVAGSGGFVLSADTEAQYLSVGKDIKVLDASGNTKNVFIIAKNSEKASDTDYLTLISRGWLLKEWTGTATWTGAESTLWSNSANWDFEIVPGITELVTGFSAEILEKYSNYLTSTNTNVIIPTSTNYPVVDNSYSIKTLTIGAENS